eukprot:2543642-Pleurochrysis_carterae.AAC.1
MAQRRAHQHKGEDHQDALRRVGVGDDIEAANPLEDEDEGANCHWGDDVVVLEAKQVVEVAFERDGLRGQVDD